MTQTLITIEKANLDAIWKELRETNRPLNVSGGEREMTTYQLVMQYGERLIGYGIDPYLPDEITFRIAEAVFERLHEIELVCRFVGVAT